MSKSIREVVPSRTTRCLPHGLTSFADGGARADERPMLRYQRSRGNLRSLKLLRRQLSHALTVARLTRPLNNIRHRA